MFVCRLTCPSCSYESEPFTDGYDVHTDTHTVLCKDRMSKIVRIARLKGSEIPAAASDDFSIESLVRSDNDEVVRTQLGVEEELDAVCPSCGHQTLLKEVMGIR